MAEQTSDFKRGENKARAATVGVLGVTFLIAAMAPQNTRAVFVTDGGLPKAFTATLASNGPGESVSYPGRNASYLSGMADPRAPGAGRRLRRSDVPPPGFANGPRAVPPVGGAGPGASAPDGLTQPILPPDQLASVATGSNAPLGAGQPFAPTISQPTAGAPGLTASTPGGGSPGSGTPGAGNPGTGTDTPTPVSPVPEPSTWVMLLSGFLLVGGALRMRRPSRHVAA